MRPYVRPQPHPCPYCGELVIHEFGVLDAAAYEDGLVRRHNCPAVPVAPLNEREWLALQEEEPPDSSAAPLETDIVAEAKAQLRAKQWLL